MPDEVKQEQLEEQETVSQSEDNDSEEMLASEEPQELPADSSERTKREFEKLKENNRRLKEELDAVQKGAPKTSVLDEYLTQSQFAPPKSVPQAVAPEVAQNLIDEQGYLNAPELEKRTARIIEADRRAQLAEEKANKALERVARFEVDAQKKQLHQSYPELDPSSETFNPDAYELVKNKLLDQLVKTGEQDPMKAASEMEKFFRKKTIPEEKQQAISQRSQAMSVGQTGRASAPSSSSLDELRKRSMTSDEAMDERIRRAGI